MEELLIAPQSGGTLFLSAGSTLRITDIQGKQVADTWAIDAKDPTRWLSVGHTLSELCRIFPKVGESFLDQYSDPILHFASDASAGPHDMFYPSCDPVLYIRDGHTDHPSCQENFRKVAAGIGTPFPGVIPNPVNFFQNSLPQASGEIDVHESISRPGDFVEVVAARDVHIIVTACSVDTYATNGWACTEISLQRVE